MKSIIEIIEEDDPCYSEYLINSVRNKINDIDECKEWLFIDGFYGPSYIDLDGEEIDCKEYNKLRNYCLDRVREAVDVIEDYISYDYLYEDEDGEPLGDPIEEEIFRVDRREIAKDLFSDIIKIYGELP